MDSNKRLFKAILFTGFLVGTLDAFAAMISAYVQHEVTPDRVFRYVASGVFGKDAFSGGIPMALLGLLFHYTVAFGWSALFLILFQKIKLLTFNKYVVGVAYGLFVLFVMNLIIVPISNVPNSKPGTVAWPQVFIHMLIVGLPIVLSANRFLRNQAA